MDAQADRINFQKCQTKFLSFIKILKLKLFQIQYFY